MKSRGSYVLTGHTEIRAGLASSWRSVSWGAVRNTASEKIGEEELFSCRASPLFSLAIFRAERLGKSSAGRFGARHLGCG